MYILGSVEEAGLVHSRGSKVGEPRLLRPHRNAKRDIYQRMNRRCFVGLTNNLSAGALTDANVVKSI